MASKPKPCKYGCGTIITWDEVNRQFNGPNHQKHDCRDWDKSQFPGAGDQQQQQQGQHVNTYSSAPPPNGETLIGVQAKKTWENYFKMLEPLTANSAAIVSLLEQSNQHLKDIEKQLKEIEDTMAVQRIKAGGSSNKPVVVGMEKEDV